MRNVIEIVFTINIYCLMLCSVHERMNCASVFVKGVKGTVHAAHSLQQYVLHTVSLQGGSLSVGDIVTLFVDEVCTTV